MENCYNYIINLRAVEPEDIDIIYKWENDHEIWLASNTLTPFSKYIIKQYIDNSHRDIFDIRQLRLMIDINISNNEIKTIGCVDLFDFEPLHKRAGVGILIHKKKDRHKGYADAALKNLIDYCFSILHLHQLYCNITSDNLHSIKLFKNNGFKEIGIKRDWIISKDGWKDEIMFQLINEI